MKGIILAAGRGSRLLPLTKVIPKCLLPVYDKPMIYYPLEVLINAGINDVMVIVSPLNKSAFESQLGDGSEFGINISYVVQKEAKGNAHAFKEAKDFIKGHKSILIFGDNIFIGEIDEFIKESIENLEMGYVSLFGVRVANPENFGVLEVNEDDEVISIEEKPKVPKSNIIAPGLYVYDESVLNKLDEIEPSPRGEYEITDVNKLYVQEGKLKVVTIDEDKCKWFDAGSVEALLEASVEAQNRKN